MLKYVCILSAALLLGLCSCTVYDRGTGNYLDYPELTETNASIVEIATLSEEERRSASSGSKSWPKNRIRNMSSTPVMC